MDEPLTLKELLDGDFNAPYLRKRILESGDGMIEGERGDMPECF